MKHQQLTLAKVTNTNFDYEFIANVFFKLVRILFRSDKTIKMIYSNCSNRHSLGNEFLVLNYRFRNALWYRINEVTTDRRQFVFSKYDSPKTIDITVYGFFRKRTFKLNVEEVHLVSTSIAASERQYSY